ncbi:hypothetical protein [Haloarcula nitratireducens]|uniref:Restriction endonuclease type IV Mrr domain-containing protein n=1 Tax=Haloarcula nitratireducens TaxID=2487749 RepID=A0AAW4PAW5_9EURY|nr:hypothetical protein [Halomicroarcula nitratireducens]MBX0294733.1 hypothetical protein [Halomicroarcula nitratireducens]
MGEIIKINNYDGGLPSLLTRTGSGGVFSEGYLRDRAAAAVLEAAETPTFVLTNRKRGVTVETGETTETVRPGRGYRTIAVVTDRRLVALVGDESGDREVAVSLADVDEVEWETGLRGGSLTVVRDGHSTVAIQTGTDGLEAVAEYLDAASRAWRRVETEFDAATELLVTATEHREEGRYDEAASAVERARERAETARGVAFRFAAEYGGTALQERVDPLETRCERTLAAIHVGRARVATDAGETRWRESEYEAAHDAYERASEGYDAALALDHAAIDDVDGIRAERDRLERIVDHLEKSPLRKAVTADKAAVAADDPEDAIEHWREAMAHYRTALEIDWGAENRRFAGDTATIRDRLGAVAENLTATQRTVAVDAMRAGDWYSDAGQAEVALAEFEAAAEAFEAALATARDCYPDAVSHLEAERDALEQRLERTQALVNGDDAVSDRFETAVEPDYAASGTLGEPSDDGPTAIEDAIRPPSEAAEASRSESVDEVAMTVDESASTVDRLRALDGDRLVAVVADVLDETAWEAAADDPDSPFDLRAARDGDRMGVVVHRSTTDDVTSERVERCQSLAEETAMDLVLFATVQRLPADVTPLPAADDVRLFDGASIAAVVDAQGVSLPDDARPTAGGREQSL